MPKTDGHLTQKANPYKASNFVGLVPDFQSTTYSQPNNIEHLLVSLDDSLKSINYFELAVSVVVMLSTA